jgi:isoamylase
MEIWPGTAYPLGATFDGAGTNFAVFSEVADRVELYLFDNSGGNAYPLAALALSVWAAATLNHRVSSSTLRTGADSVRL